MSDSITMSRVTRYHYKGQTFATREEAEAAKLKAELVGPMTAVLSEVLHETNPSRFGREGSYYAAEIVSEFVTLKAGVFAQFLSGQMTSETFSKVLKSEAVSR